MKPGRFINERNVYWVMAIISLIPVCLTKYIGSLDGPSHLHVSNVINGLITGNQTIKEFFQFTSPIIGNVSGIYLLAIFNMWLPAWLAEKLLILTYLIGFYAAFRYLILSINSKPGFLSLLIFPFAYNSLFMLGYYNFSFGLVLMMVIAGFWVRYYRKPVFMVYLVMALLLTFLYYTHLVMFVFTLVVIGLFTFGMFTRDIGAGKPHAIRTFLVRGAGLVAGALPGLVMGMLYMKMIPESTSAPAQPFDHWQYIIKFQHLVGFDHTTEDTLGSIVFLALVGAIVIILSIKLFSVFVRKSTHSATSFNVDIWLIIAIAFIALFFLVPNIMSLKVRLIVAFSLILITWIAVQKVPVVVSLLISGVVLFAGFRYQQIHVEHYRESQKMIKQIVQLEEFLSENETIATFNYSENWLFYNFSHYVGIEKNIIDLRAAAISPLFAVNWKKNKPFTYIGARNAALFIDTSNSQYSKKNSIATHVIILGYREFARVSEFDKYALIINRDYILIYESPDKMLAVFQYSYPKGVDENIRILTQNEDSQANLQQKAEEYDVPLNIIIERDALWLYDNLASRKD